jgi:plasmid stabilization system protein ParE
MSRRVIVRPEAEVDIQAAHDYLQQISAGLGELFSTRLRDVFERIESAPESIATIWQDVRAVRVRRFQYVVYYVAFSDRVEVLAILHGARHESVWRSRAK